MDKYAFNYCFHQMRADFLNGNILEILKLKDSALGLAVADMLRMMLEQNMSLDAVQKDYRSFLPKEINKNYKFGIKKPIQRALMEARTNCKEDAMFVKVIMNLLIKMLTICFIKSHVTYSVCFLCTGAIHATSL